MQRINITPEKQGDPDPNQTTPEEEPTTPINPIPQDTDQPPARPRRIVRITEYEE